jgi:hypothetical protein
LQFARLLRIQDEVSGMHILSRDRTRGDVKRLIPALKDAIKSGHN